MAVEVGARDDCSGGGSPERADVGAFSRSLYTLGEDRAEREQK